MRAPIETVRVLAAPRARVSQEGARAGHGRASFRRCRARVSFGRVRDSERPAPERENRLGASLEDAGIALRPVSLALKPVSLSLRPVFLVLKPMSLSLRPVSLALKAMSLSLKPVFLVLKAMSLSLRPVSLALKAMSLSLKPVFLALKPISLWLKPISLALGSISLARRARSLVVRASPMCGTRARLRAIGLALATMPGRVLFTFALLSFVFARL
jgi:hypothetical protein